MAASFHEGTASGPKDLLQGIVTWLTAQGWHVNLSASDGGGEEWRAHLDKGGAFINLRSTANTAIFPNVGPATTAPGIGIIGSTGFNGSLAWSLQPGGALGSGETYAVGAFMNLPAGAIVGWRGFDDGADNIIVVVERTGGVFTHLGFGVTLTKAGAWTGGAYFFAALAARYGGTEGISGASGATANCPFGVVQTEGYTNSWLAYGYNGYVRAAMDTFTGWVGFSNNNTWVPDGYTGAYGSSGIDLFPGAGGSFDWSFPTYAGMSSLLVSEMHNQAVLLPVHLYARRSSGGFSMLGTVPSIYYAGAVGHGFLAGSIYTVGALSFMLFPHFAVLKAA